MTSFAQAWHQRAACLCLQWSPLLSSCRCITPPFDWVTKVHVVYMTHLDVGFTGLTNEVCDLYFNHHFPAAMATAAALKKRGGEEQFIYTSHPWLLQEQLDSAVHCATVNTTQQQRQTLIDAIHAGVVSWHAQPFTMLSPMLDPQLFAFSLSLSRALDDRFNKSRKTAASTKDAMGHTVSAVPVFAAAGINSLHIGANAACVAPDVPPAFLWRHEASATQLLTMLYNVPTARTPCTWTPFCSYGGDVVLPNVSVALVYQFTLDNSSPASADDVLSLWSMIRSNYPNASIAASSLDAFSNELLTLAGSGLPVVTDEIGDSWLYGVQSDPYKIAAFRAISRRLPELERSGIGADDISAFKRRLLKNPEHNFGLSVGATNVNSYGWTNDEFYRHYNDSAADFHKLDQGWTDPEVFCTRLQKHLRLYTSLSTTRTHSSRRSVRIFSISYLSRARMRLPASFSRHSTMKRV